MFLQFKRIIHKTLNRKKSSGLNGEKQFNLLTLLDLTWLRKQVHL